MLNMVDGDNFVVWLEERMLEKGLSQSQLAQEGGITRSAVSKLLTRQQQKPGVDMLTAIAKALNLPPELVFRKAGMLPARSIEEIDYEELKVLYSKLNDRDKNDVLDYIRMRIKRRQQIERSIRERYKFVPKDDPKALLAFIRDVLSEFGGYDEV